MKGALTQGLPFGSYRFTSPELLWRTHLDCLPKGQAGQGLYPQGLRATLEAFILGVLSRGPSRFLELEAILEDNCRQRLRKLFPGDSKVGQSNSHQSLLSSSTNAYELKRNPSLYTGGVNGEAGSGQNPKLHDNA